MTHLEKKGRTLERRLNVALAKLEFDVPAQAVHRLRTTARRIQTFLGLGDLKLRGRERGAIRELERVRQRAGKVRNLDAQLSLLRALGNRSAAKDRQVLRQRLLDKRGKKAERLSAATRDMVQSRFADHLHAALQQGVAAAGSGSDQERSPLFEARLKLQQLSRNFAGQPPSDPEQLHRLRLDLKIVRYLAELVPGSEAARQLTEQVQAVQSVLGEWRDWGLLARTAEKQFSQRSHCALLAEIRARLAAQQARVAPALTRLFSPLAERKQPQAVTSRRVVAHHA